MTTLIKIEQYINKAQTALNAGFNTKAARKNALDNLGRAYDLVRRQTYDFETTGELPYSFAHYRPAKHEDALCNDQTLIKTVSRLLSLRETIKNALINNPVSNAQQERAILQRSPIPAIAAEFEPLKASVKQDYINKVRTMAAALLEEYNNDWSSLSQINVYSNNHRVWTFVRNHVKYINNKPAGIDEDRLDKLATRYANDQVDAFVHKLALKLVDLENVKLHGVNTGSFEFALTGNLNDQRVKVVQNIKYGLSKFNNPYVQWPALIYVDGKKVSELEFQKLTNK